MLRTCSKCGVEKVVSDFGADVRRISGLRAACKPCMAAAERAKYVKRGCPISPKLRRPEEFDDAVMSEDVAERLWSYVRKGAPDECWEWQGYRRTNGYPYGRVKIYGRYFLATRIILSQKLKRPLRNGECALHKCDNPPCCNPDHLFSGSIRDNVHDMIAKGRHRFGTRHRSTS